MRITEFDGSTITATSSDRLLTSCPGIDQFSSAATDDIIIQNYRVSFKHEYGYVACYLLQTISFFWAKLSIIYVHEVKQLL